MNRQRHAYSANKDPRASRSRDVGLAAARTILLSEGLAAMTHARVAEVAGLHRATVYRHWPSVSDLLLDVTNLEADSTMPAPTGDVAADLFAALQVAREDLVEHGFARFLATLAANSHDDAELDAAKLRIMAEGLSAIRSIITSAVAHHDLPDGLDADLGVSQLIGPILYRCLFTAEPISDAFIAALVESYLAANPVPSQRPPVRTGQPR